jgi:hypothetical protein
MNSDTAVYDPSMPICLWRSIICSAFGTTMFPYALWIKSLRLGNLTEVLEVVSKDTTKESMNAFFAEPLKEFHILRKDMRASVKGKWHGLLIDIDTIVIQVTSKVTEFIKESAHEQNTIVGLGSLEGNHLPTAALSNWLGNLSQLTSLAIRDGSVLNANVGKIIADNCPAFKEVYVPH